MKARGSGKPSARVLVIEDHGLTRAGAKALLGELASNVFVREVATAEEALPILSSAPAYDLVMLDLGLPGLSGLDAFDAILQRAKGAPIVVVTAVEHGGTAREVLRRGARGFVPKTLEIDVLRNALALVLSGGTYVPPSVLQAESAEPEPQASALTERQLVVLREVARGMSNRQIAEALGIAEGTVRVHVQAILRALGVANRTQAAGTRVARELLG